MRGVILNVQITNHAAPQGLGDNEEMVRLGDTAIAALAVPPRLAVAVNDGIWFRGDRNVGAPDLD